MVPSVSPDTRKSATDLEPYHPPLGSPLPEPPRPPQELEQPPPVLSAPPPSVSASPGWPGVVARAIRALGPKSLALLILALGAMYILKADGLVAIVRAMRGDPASEKTTAGGTPSDAAPSASAVDEALRKLSEQVRAAMAAARNADALARMAAEQSGIRVISPAGAPPPAELATTGAAPLAPPAPTLRPGTQVVVPDPGPSPEPVRLEQTK